MSETSKERSRARRDLFTLAAGGFVGAGILFAAWPFIDQMNPNAGTPSPETTDVDIGSIAPAQSIRAAWRQLPIIIRHRTTAEIDASRAVSLDKLPDPLARNQALPADATASDVNRTLKDKPEWLVVFGICPRMNCVLQWMESFGVATVPEETFICPCCSSRFDAAGRVRSGPAATNLIIPPFRFLTPARIRIG